MMDSRLNRILRPARNMLLCKVFHALRLPIIKTLSCILEESLTVQDTGQTGAAPYLRGNQVAMHWDRRGQTPSSVFCEVPRA